MTDPLSITTGVLALLTKTVSVGWQLKQFCDGAAFADTKLKSLITDVGSFRLVIESMKDTFDQDSVKISLKDTGHVETHWNNLATLLKDALATITKLEAALTKVNKSVGFLDGARKHVRHMGAANEILVYQQQIQAYRDTLQLSLQTIVLWNQVTLQESSKTILPGLDVIYKEIRRLAATFNARIFELEILTKVDVSNNPQEEMTDLVNLQSVVRSAASIVSSASTIMEVGHESNFGDVFPLTYEEPMLRWMADVTIHENKDDEIIAIGSTGENYQQKKAEGEADSDSDSDNDLELELFEAIAKRAEGKLEANDIEGAEEDFRHCLTRIPTIPRSRHDASRIQIIHKLSQVCAVGGKYDEARLYILELLSLLPQDSENEKLEILSHTLRLSNILKIQKAYPEAMLYGRKAFKGFRRLNQGPGAEKSLDLLIEICNEDDNLSESYAFKAIREEFLSTSSETEHRSELSSILGPKSNSIPQDTNSSRSEGKSISPPQSTSSHKTASMSVPASPSLPLPGPIVPTTTNAHTMPQRQIASQASPDTNGKKFSVSNAPELKITKTITKQVIFAGTESCGKTDFLRWAVANTSYSTECKHTAAEPRDFIIHCLLPRIKTRLTMNVEELPIEAIDVFDEKYASGVTVICFDISDKASWDRAVVLVTRFLEPRKTDDTSYMTRIVMLGLKMDKSDCVSGQFIMKNGERTARALGARLYLQCSAKTGEGAWEAVRAICALTYNSSRRGSRLLSILGLARYDKTSAKYDPRLDKYDKTSARYNPNA